MDRNKIVSWLIWLMLGIVPVQIIAQPARATSGPTPECVSNLKCSKFVLQLGWYWGRQGQEQHIGLSGLIGDDFLLDKKHDDNVLVGAGYFLNGLNRKMFKLYYGINAFYLAKSAVDGEVLQEELFTNLSYLYDVSHVPVYLAAKAVFSRPQTRNALTVDVGVGPNFMTLNNWHEASIDGGVTSPDNLFVHHLNTTLSATAGIGLQMKHVFKGAPLECGYRFFYLGRGHLRRTSSAVLGDLNTGNVYANAVVCSTML